MTEGISDLEEHVLQILEFCKVAYWEGFKAAAGSGNISRLASDELIEKLWNDSGTKNGFLDFLVDEKIGKGGE